MVALIDSGDISDLLDQRRYSESRHERYTVAWRTANWKDAKSHLALLLDENDHIRWLGRARGRRRVSDRDRRIEVVEIEEFADLPLGDLRDALPVRHRAGLQLGVLTDAVGREVVQVLISLYPEWEEVIQRLGQQEQFRLPANDRGLILNEQRDGTCLLLEIGGIDREPLRGWSPDESDVPSFLAGLGPRSVSEETIIDYDLERFPGLVRGGRGYVDWRVFGNDRRQMWVMNANTEPLEETLGVDVIYYNKTFKSFVLVQYKRMVRESDRPGRGELWYRPDKKNLPKELASMKVVDERFGSRDDGAFRLYAKPCWVKLCDSYAVVQEPTQFISGLYLPRDYFMQLLEVCKGPQGGPRLGYDNVPRHITNTSFAQLARDGWIGTSGVSTSELEQVVASVLESRRALVLGVPLGS